MISGGLYICTFLSVWFRGTGKIRCCAYKEIASAVAVDGLSIDKGVRAASSDRSSKAEYPIMI